MLSLFIITFIINQITIIFTMNNKLNINNVKLNIIKRPYPYYKSRDNIEAYKKFKSSNLKLKQNISTDIIDSFTLININTKENERELPIKDDFIFMLLFLRYFGRKGNQYININNYFYYIINEYNLKDIIE